MNRLLCYAHYDENGELRDFVRHALESMAEVCSAILFVSNSPLPEHEKVYLEKICRRVIVNDNLGYDFFMWRTALETCDYTQFDEIVLMNSSVYGPFRPVEAVFREMSTRSCDFWGMTECFQMRPHVQSYFLVFGKKLIASAEFASFWRSVLPYNNKNQVVMSYEVGLSQWFLDSGFEMGVYCGLPTLTDYAQRLGKKVKLSDNPSLKHPIELLHLGVPFLKRELVKKNAVDIRSVAPYLETGGYPVDDLQEHDSAVRHACPVCGAPGKACHKRLKDRVDVHNIERYDYLRCLNRECGILWMHPVPNDDAMKFVCDTYYGRVDDAPGLGTGALRPSFPVSIVTAILRTIIRSLGIDRKRARFYLHGLEKVSPGKLLEIGCGNGDRLVRLRELGWDVTGHEVCGSVARALQEKGIKAVEGDMETADLAGNQFDVILLSHSLERSRNLRSLLSECHRFLKPGGKICLTTLNTDSLTRKMFGKYWFGLDVPRNLMILNAGSLKRLLAEASYGDIEIETAAVNGEVYAMHSLDILVNKWTYLKPGPRVGRELLPMAWQMIIYFAHGVTKGLGDEIFATASKIGITQRNDT